MDVLLPWLYLMVWVIQVTPFGFLDLPFVLIVSAI